MYREQAVLFVGIALPGDSALTPHNRSASALMSPKVFRPATIARFAITALVLAFLFTRLDWGRLVALSSEVNVLWVAAACLLFGATYVLAAIRWWVLLRGQEVKLSLARAVSLTFVSHFFNAFLLGSSGGDLAKIYYVLKEAPTQRAQAVASILMDRILGLGLLLCFATAAIPFFLRDLLGSSQTRAFVFALPLALGVFLCIPLVIGMLRLRHLPAWFLRFWHRLPHWQSVERGLRVLRGYLRSPRPILAATAIGAAIDVLIFCGGYALAQALEIKVTFWQIMTILAIVICVVSVPISVGGHGVREFAFIALFAMFGLSGSSTTHADRTELAVLYSVLFFGTLTVWSIVGGVVYLFRGRGIRPNDPLS